jgi:hypothetical protein
MGMKKELKVIDELIQRGEIIIWNARTNVLHSGCDIRGAGINGNAIQLWLEECGCHRSDRDPVLSISPHGIFLPCGEFCTDCGCELEKYWLEGRFVE